MSHEQPAPSDLPNSAERLRAILDTAIEAIITIDERGRIESVNPATERLFGFSAAEMVGQNVSMLMPSPDRERHDGYLANYLRTGHAKIIGIGREVVCKRSDGTLFPADLSVNETRLATRRIFTGILRDITERKRAEQEIEEARARLEGIVGSAMDAIITVDDEQLVVLFNAAAEKMFGYPAAEAIGSSLDRFIPARFRKAHGQHIRRFGETGTTSRTMGTLGALSALRANGEEFPIEASISQVEVRGRKLFTVILRDVTERTDAEAASMLRTQQQEAVADLSRHALLGRDLSRLLTDAVALVAQVLEVEFAKLLELNAAGDELFLRAGVGWRDGWVGLRTVAVGHESHAGYTLLCNAPVVVEDLASEKRFRAPPLLVEHGVVSGLSVVIRGRARPFGVLGAHTTSRRVFGNDDVHFLQSIADVLAAAIERRQLEEELLNATGREQRRIGQDLHDGLCQHLAGIEFRTEALAGDLEDNPAAREELEKIGALMRDGTRQARMLARGLAPVELEKNGLMAALKELAANSAHLFRIECSFRCEQTVLVTDEAIGTQIYRIAQEAISNAVRHARAKKIEIVLRLGGNEAVLTVTNDGAPLPAEPGRSGGMGLRIMQYRAELIGATVRLGSTTEGKTELKCTFNPHR